MRFTQSTMGKPEAVEDFEDFKKYTEPVYIKVHGVGNIYWHPEADMLMPDHDPESMEMNETIVDFIDSMSRGSSEIKVTPVGPFLPADETDIHTLIWAIHYLYSEFKIEVIGPAPTLGDIGLDDEDGSEEDGSSIVY